MPRAKLSKLMKSILRSRESSNELRRALVKGGHVVHKGKVYSVRLGK